MNAEDEALHKVKWIRRCKYNIAKFFILSQKTEQERLRDFGTGREHGSQINFAPWGDVEMVARILSLREREGVDAVDPVGTGFRLHSSLDVVGGERLLGDELEGESSLSSLTGELGGLEATWVDSAPEVEECGNVRVAVGGVLAGGDGGRVDGIAAVAEEDLDVSRFGGDC